MKDAVLIDESEVGNAYSVWVKNLVHKACRRFKLGRSNS